jgi:hypothetical protein
MQSGNSGKVFRVALLVSISHVKGTLNKAAGGLSRAHDDGLTKSQFDNQLWHFFKHPNLVKEKSLNLMTI